MNRESRTSHAISYGTTAALTGLRQSELLGLRWRDIDWMTQGIRVTTTNKEKL
jgi:integrase